MIGLPSDRRKRTLTADR